ncbi:hypothetical protein ACM26X_15525 [Kluyvera cryocrescens]|uniref:hypothetical protein n=1 Tax=Kluyvera cryocrescens TaxID=580 RepID=UPI0039F5A21E
MKKILNTLQVNYFTNNNDVTATPPILGMLLAKLSSLSLLPMFAHEVNALTGERRQIIIMTDADQNFRIEFPMQSIVFTGNNIEISDFFNKVESALEALKSIFPDKKSNRLAIVNSSFYRADKEKYSELYKKMFTYHQVDPIEWENRIVERKNFGSSAEIANMVSSARRCSVQHPFVDSGNLVDVINFEVDTNTIPENVNNRFDFTSSIPVLRELYNKNNELIESFSRYANV